MSPSDLIREAAEKCAEGDLRAFARLIDTPERTLYRWVSGESPMPGAARLLVQMLVERPKIAKALTFRPGQPHDGSASIPRKTRTPGSGSGSSVA